MHLFPRCAFALLLLLPLPALAEEDQILETIRRGIALHDAAKFDEAIAAYREALRLQPNHPMALYELAMTLSASGRPAECVSVGEQALKSAKEHRLELYTVTGNCLDEAGNPKKAVKIYKKGLKEFPNDAYLAFNFAVTEFGQQRYGKARQLIETAITERPGHASSYRLLAHVFNKEGSPIRALLSALRFLAIEPVGARAREMAGLAYGLFNRGVEKKSENEISITVDTATMGEGPFSSIATFVGLLSASRFLENNSGKPESAKVAMQLESLLKILDESPELVRPGSFDNDRLVLPLVAILRAGHQEAFAYQAFSTLELEGAQEWMDAHPPELAALAAMLRSSR
jgi:tetratricopeptide (TPR) repeat protein